MSNNATNHNTADRNLALELVRATEAAALSASRWMGRGDKEGADGAAVDAMRDMLAKKRRLIKCKDVNVINVPYY